MTRKELWEQRYRRLQRRIAPNLKYSQTIYEEIVREHVRDGSVWLEAGCGHQIFPEWRSSEEQETVSRARMVVGVDLDFEGMKKHRTIERVVYSNLEQLPFASESFGLVTCNMVVEHLADPGAVFKEFYRVLRPGGKVIIHTPNALGYTTIAARMLPQRVRIRLAGILENRPAEDVFPAHYRANTPRRLRALLGEAGFQEEKMRLIATACALYFSRFLVFFELLYVRLTLLPVMKNLRTNIICVYVKPGR
ncbi:MAG: class I SAM-dependent methyltransferase [Acidobacteriota bacterium]